MRIYRDPVTAVDLVPTSRHRHRRRGVLTMRGFVIWTFAAGCVACIAAYPFLSRTGRTIDFLVVSLGALPPTLWTLQRRPKGHRAPWVLLFVALLMLNIDNVVWYYYTDVEGRLTGDGTIADLFATLGHVTLLTSALTILFRRGRGDVGGLIDTTIVSMAVGGLLWDFVLL